MSDTTTQEQVPKTIIVKKDKKEAKKQKLYKLGSKLFLIFHALAVVYALLYTIGTLYYCEQFIAGIPGNIKSGIKFLFMKNNHEKYVEYLAAKHKIDQQLAYFNDNLSYYRWRSIVHFFTVSLKEGIKSIYNSISLKNMYNILVKKGIYGIPKILVTNLLFRINNFYYISLFAHGLGTLTLLHFQVFQQRSLRVFSSMSNYDAMSVNYLQMLMLNVISFISAPAVLKLVPFTMVSLASLLKGNPDLQKKINSYIPAAFICSLIPYLIRTLVLSSGEGFFCTWYALIIVVKCKFNKYDSLVLLKIVAFIDKKVNKKAAKKEDHSLDSKVAKWNSLKRSIVAETIML